MSLEILRQLVHGALHVALLLLCVAGGWVVWLAATHLHHRASGRARERALLGEPLPTDDGLPDVLVQLPIFNEISVAQRVIEAAAALDWPRDKLHVQVLDDSTDRTAEIVREVTDSLRARGLDVTAIRRAERVGFKAGALREGLRRAPYEYVAIFDADFVPAADFLRLCMRPMIWDHGLAFVQARWDWLNPRENALTRAQQLMLDGSFAVEQTAKNWSGNLTHFCGSGGIWRRRAIDHAGGWAADTLVEDIDLCYRAQLGGWRSLYLVGVTVPCELPDTVEAWRAQQARWSKGFGQLARKQWRPIWRSGMSLGFKTVASLNLATSMSGAVVNLALVAGAIDILIGRGPSMVTGALAAMALAGTVGGGSFIFVLGQRELRGATLGAALRTILWSITFYVYLQLRGAVTFVAGLRGKAGGFVRTPKKGTVVAALGRACPNAGRGDRRS
jgi:cellulose synthase/poly-beta-1,6-N-acetylglucosamine synthase-like glycosyltransferase